MDTTYSVTINMPGNTAQTLKDGGYYLYAFKAVGGGLPAGGSPLVWFQTQAFAQSVVITWQEQYAAFTSTTDIEPGVTIIGTNSYRIKLGQELLVTGSTGAGTVQNGSDPHSIGIDSATTANLTCGISQMVVGQADPSPLCAFPLLTEMTDVIEPIEQVVFMFATKPYNNGSVIEQAFSPGILLDLTGAPNNSGSITYDLNNGGWAAAGSVPTTPINKKDSLIPLLIQPSAAKKAVLAKLATAQ